MSDNSRAAGAAALVTVVLWASAFVAIRSAGGHFSPGALALGRLFVASLALGVTWLVSGDGWLLHEGFPRRLGAGMAVSAAEAVVVGVSESGGGRNSVTGVVLPRWLTLAGGA